jgi:membrane fusion protein (multidrug efflux system)
VQLVADVYGKSVRYTGRVIGQEAGTGNAFSLLPAQNASGNWVKVVQRVPVRIALDPKQLAEHPLKIGLSMHVDVDTSQPGSTTPAATTAYRTDVFEHELQDADAAIARIIAANVGGAKLARVN